MTASQRAYGGRRTAQGGEVDAQAVLARSMSERDLQASVEELARLLGWLVYHTYDSRRSAPGFPDLVMAKPDGRTGPLSMFKGPLMPRVIFAELKAENGRMSADQRAWGDALADVAYESVERGNVAYYVFRPSDWLDGTIERVLRGEDA